MAGSCAFISLMFVRAFVAIFVMLFLRRLPLEAIYSKRDYILPDYSEELYLQGFGLWVLFIFGTIGWFRKFKYPGRLDLSCMWGVHISTLIVQVVEPDNARHRRLNNTLMDALTYSRRKYEKGLKAWPYDLDLPKANRVWDKLQRNLDCCGIFNPNEWQASRYGLGSYPPSCCHHWEVDSHIADSLTTCQRSQVVDLVPCMTRIRESAETNLYACQFLLFCYFLSVFVFHFGPTLDHYLKTKTWQFVPPRPIVVYAPNDQPTTMNEQHRPTTAPGSGGGVWEISAV